VSRVDPRIGGGRLRRGLLAAAKGTAVAVLVGALAVGLINLWVLASTRRRVHTRLSTVPRAPVAIVFGAAVRPDGTLSPVTRDRVKAGADLYRSGRVRRLLLSGDHGRGAYDEVYAMRREALRRGVAARDIFLDPAGFSTYDTLARARWVYGVRSAVLVSQRFHLPRALMIARLLGIRAVGLAADRRPTRSECRMAARESAARVKDFVKAGLRVPPVRLGPAVALRGDGRITLDSVPRARAGGR